MSEKAFPNEHVIDRSSGMDLRDYFAAKALPVLYHAQIQYSEFRGYPANWKETIAKDAYAMADEMMRVREPA